MRKITSLIFAASMLPALPAGAVPPENGLYYNPGEQGLGYYIEVQGSTLVMVAFAYDKDTGKPLFYYAAGNITRATPAHPLVDDPAVPEDATYEDEFPYQFDAPLYRFSAGPCLLCHWTDWLTTPYAMEAGHVRLRMADLNRITATFSIGDGEQRTLSASRQGFGRAGYHLGRWDAHLLSDLRGEWVFVRRGDRDAPAWHFDFTEVSGPSEPTGTPIDFHGRRVTTTMKFTDPETGADLECARFGCALTQAGETLFLVNFSDIGSDSLLGYVGDALYETVIDYDELNYYQADPLKYRGADLVIGRRIADPAPDAAPPPDGE